MQNINVKTVSTMVNYYQLSTILFANGQTVIEGSDDKLKQVAYCRGI